MFLGRALLLTIWPALGLALAQTAPVVLDIEVENAVRYVADVGDVSKLAQNTAATPAAETRAFTDTILIGDIVAINGSPAKGLWTSRQFTMNFGPNPAPGAAIADVSQGTIAECKYEIQNSSGAFIGRLMDGGLFPHAVTGGTGAFVGAKGEQATGTARVVRAVRTASMAEDPAVRRANGGGNVRIIMRLIPAVRPEIVSTENGAAVTHADGSPVSISSPALAGEVLTLYATGLGPTTPAVAFGQPFSQDTVHAVNAPVEVALDGKPAVVLYAGGYPGAVDGYQVNFRLPDEINPASPASRTAGLRITAAWIRGSDVRIAIK
jgi:uncharacterized protein (TIGR03437 family)